MDNSSQHHDDKVIYQCSQSFQGIIVTDQTPLLPAVSSIKDGCGIVHNGSGCTSPAHSSSSSRSSDSEDKAISENDKSTYVSRDLMLSDDMSIATTISEPAPSPAINQNEPVSMSHESHYPFFSSGPDTQLSELLEPLGSGNCSPAHSSVSEFTPNDDHEYSVHAKVEKLGRIVGGLETFGALEDSLTPTQRILLEGVRQELSKLCEQERARRLFVFDGLFVHSSSEKMLESLGVFRKLRALLERNKHITSDDMLKFFQTTRADQHMEMVHALLDDLRRTYTALGTLEARVDALKFSKRTLKTHRSPGMQMDCPNWPCIFWRVDGCNNRVFTEGSACFRHKDIKLVKNGLVTTPWA